MWSLKLRIREYNSRHGTLRPQQVPLPSQSRTGLCTAHWKDAVFQYQYMTVRECSHAVKVNWITHKGLKTKHSMFIYFRALIKRDLVTVWAQTIKFIFPFLMYIIVNIVIVNASSKFEISSNKQETEFEKKKFVFLLFT